MMAAASDLIFYIRGILNPLSCIRVHVDEGLRDSGIIPDAAPTHSYR